MITGLLKVYSHRVLLILTYIFLAILLFGILGQSFSATILEFFDIIFGASIVILLRKVIATYDTKELFKLCFSLAFIDWLLYKGNIQFRTNIESKFKNVSGFKNYPWE
jgi:hypothetical protein